MNRRSILALGASASLTALAAGIGPATAGIVQAPAGTTAAAARTQAIAAAATALVDRLDPGLRARLLFPFPRQPLATPAYFKGGLRGDVTFVGEHYGDSMWSNFPVSDVPRPGLRLGELDASGRDAVMGLLAVALSRQGYAKVLDIMGADQALADAGAPFACGIDSYTLAILGTPNNTAPWMVQFGGHHLALNLTLMGERAVLAPVLTGAQPAVHTRNGRTVRALASENDKGFALLAMFDADQRRRAVSDGPVDTLELGPGRDGETIPLQGLSASAMDAGQRTMLLDLVSDWAGIVNADHAAPRLAGIAADLPDTWFAWKGPTTHEPNHNGASYFRVQGPTTFVEFAPQRVGGDPTQHVHTIYRDFPDAYGRAFVPHPAWPARRT